MSAQILDPVKIQPSNIMNTVDSEFGVELLKWEDGARFQRWIVPTMYTPSQYCLIHQYIPFQYAHITTALAKAMLGVIKTPARKSRQYVTQVFFRTGELGKFRSFDQIIQTLIKV